MSGVSGSAAGFGGRARVMVAIHAAYTAATLLAVTFLSIFLWRAGHDLTLIALFTGLTTLTIPLAFVLNGMVFRRAGAGTSIRLGLAALGLTYLAVIGLGQNAVHWVLPLGLLRGLGEGWYWAGYHLATYDSTDESNRDRYFGAQAAVNWLLSALLPPVAGAIIVAGSRWGGAYFGYQVVFGAAALVLAGAVVLAGRLECGQRPTFSLREAVVVGRRNAPWRWVTWARLADGFSGSLSGLVLTVLTFLLLRNEQQVGTFNGLLGLIGVAISVGLAAFMRPRYRIPVALVGAAMLVLSTLVLPLYLSATALFAYGVLRAFGGPLHGNALAPIALQVIDRDPRARDRRYEYIVHQELCLGAGRVLSIGAFLLLAAPVDQLLLSRIAIVVCGAAPMVILAMFAQIRASAPAADTRALPAAA